MNKKKNKKKEISKGVNDRNDIRLDEKQNSAEELLKSFDMTIQNPSSTPYAHSRGSAVIKSVNRKHIAKRGIEAMSEQIDTQMAQIMEQMKLMAEQVEGLREKKKLSMIIYGAQMNFKPLVGETYFLYSQMINEKLDYILSILSPEDWGEKWMDNKDFVAKVYLSGDYSWEILEQNTELILPN